MPGSLDCLQSSEDCVQFPIKKGMNKAEWGKSQDCISALPLDENTSECGVYTSEKLNMWKIKHLGTADKKHKTEIHLNILFKVKSEQLHDIFEANLLMYKSFFVAILFHEKKDS